MAESKTIHPPAAPSSRSSHAYIVVTAFLFLFPMLVRALYNDALKSYAVGFAVLIILALARAIIVSFLSATSESPNKVEN